MAKPTLYLDVDDTIIAECYKGSGLDLRPGVVTQLRVLSRMFKCVWLTCWPKKPLYELMRLLYGARLNAVVLFGDWAHDHPWRKAGYVLNPGKPQDFWWLEDPLCPEEIKALEDHGKLNRYIQVEPYGNWAFLDSVNELFSRCGFNDSDIKRVGGIPEWFKKEAILAEDSSKENNRKTLMLLKFITESNTLSPEDRLKEIRVFIDSQLKTKIGENVVH